MRPPHPSVLGAVYGVSEIVLGLSRRAKSGHRSMDRSSLRVLWAAICAAVAGSLFVGARCRFASLHSAWLPIAGTALFVFGLFLRWRAIIQLGRFFTVDVAITEQHRLVDTGVYRWVRHPSYSGALLAFIGFGLCLCNWAALVVLMLPIVAAFLWRIHVEEQALLNALGQDYREYGAHTKRLIPLVY